MIPAASDVASAACVIPRRRRIDKVLAVVERSTAVLIVDSVPAAMNG